MHSHWFSHFSRPICKSQCIQLCFICVSLRIRSNSIPNRHVLQLLTRWSQSLRLINLHKSHFSFSGRNLWKIGDAIQWPGDARLWIVIYLKATPFLSWALQSPHVSEFDAILQSYSTGLAWRSFSESRMSNLDQWSFVSTVVNSANCHYIANIHKSNNKSARNNQYIPNILLNMSL
jgi:hypothetical protein